MFPETLAAVRDGHNHRWCVAFRRAAGKELGDEGRMKAGKTR
jgi:hypothetical protein